MWLALGMFAIIFSATSSGPTVHARLLFYADVLGNTFAVSGPLSAGADHLLQEAIRRANHVTPNITLALHPIYNTSGDVPKAADFESITRNLRKQYSHVYSAELNDNVSTAIMRELRRRNFLEQTRRADDKDAKKKEGDAANKNNEEKDGTKNVTKKASNETASNGTQIILNSPEHFIPNSIYYAIEKKCANWNDDCDSNSSITGLYGQDATKMKIGENWANMPWPKPMKIVFN